MKDENTDKLVFIGDRYIDFEAAKNTGNISIGVSHGFGREELKKADYVVDNPCDIVQIIEEINKE
jgi:phosphoglycolate phosphatase-like HAD superfamily hydrolase